MNNKKKIILGSIIGVLIGSLISVSYAFFTFSKTSNNNSQLVVGDIYMKYGESNQLELSNAMPSETYDSSKYFEFTITGKNTYSKPIIYDISIIHGDNHATRTRRLADKFLKFTLIKEETGKEPVTVVDGKSYSDFQNGTRIAVGTIPKEQNSEITYTYKLYMWIDKNVVIGNVNQDYTETEWNEIFASVKVNVTGDFEEKEVARSINQVINTTTKDTGIKFYEISSLTNGQGLYMMESTENDPYPIYYYRGNVDNNNVYFAENCWKIVRTTSTGGLKLVYNGAATIVDGEKQCLETTGDGTQLSVGTKKFNSSSNSPAYVGYSLPESSKRYSYSTQTLNGVTYYGSSVDQATKRLVDPVLELNDTHHYSYNSTDPDATGISGDTGNVRYYYYKNSASGTSRTGYFIKFDKTKSVSTILDEMLSENNSKNNPSVIQEVINDWWGTGGDNSLNSKYGEFLEDTEWCNDRSIASYGGWSPTGTLYSSNWKDYLLIFTERVRYDQEAFGTDANNIKNTNTPILTCSRPVDRLTVANGNLTYPIGLLTYDELAMAGVIWFDNINNTSYYLDINQTYWLLSPIDFSYTNARVGGVDVQLRQSFVNSSYSVRPALSLKSGTEILKGDGTKTKPYIITED